MGRTQSWETGGWGCPRALPFSPAPPRSSDLGVQAAERGDRRGAAGQAEAAPRPALLHPGLEKRKGPCVRVSAADPLGTEMGSGTPRSEEAEEKEPVVWGLGGWGGPGLGQHTNNHAKRGGRPWQLQGGGGSCLQPKTENRGSFILALCAPTRNLPLSVLRKLPSPAFFRLPSATCLLPSHTHHKPSLRSPGDTRNVHQAAPPSPARELTSSGVPRTGEKRVVLGLPATASLLLLRCCLLRPQSQLSTHSFCLSLSSFVVSLPLTLSLSF